MTTQLPNTSSPGTTTATTTSTTTTTTAPTAAPLTRMLIVHGHWDKPKASLAYWPGKLSD